MTSKADKLSLETEPVARDNNTILTLKPGDQTLSRLTQLIIVVYSAAVSESELKREAEAMFLNTNFKRALIFKFWEAIWVLCSEWLSRSTPGDDWLYFHM